MKKYVNGEFIIQINKVGSAGEDLQPKSPPPSKANTSTSIGKKKGPVPRPYLEKGDRAQRNDVAAISKGQDHNALYKAASRKIGKIDADKGYIMRLMNRKPGMASKLKKFHLLHRKNKGFLLNSIKNIVEYLFCTLGILFDTFQSF